MTQVYAPVSLNGSYKIQKNAADITAPATDIEKLYQNQQVFAESLASRVTDFPIAGTLRTGNCVKGVSLSPSTAYTLLSVATGNSGIVRALSFVIQGNTLAQITAALGACNICVWYDGHSTSGTPDISVPLGSLIGYENITAANLYSSEFDADLFSITRKFRETTDSEQNAYDGTTFEIRYPMPFTDGIVVQLVADSGVSGVILYANAVYQDSLPLCWNRNLRFYADRLTGSTAAPTHTTRAISWEAGSNIISTVTASTFTSADIGKFIRFPDPTSGGKFGGVDAEIVGYTDTQHVTVEANALATGAGASGSGTTQGFYRSTAFTAFSRPAAEKGFLVGIYARRKPSVAAWAYLETGPRFYPNVNGSTVGVPCSMVFTGGEDFFLGSFYFASQFTNKYGGIVQYDTTGCEMSAYRLWTPCPLYYSDGCLVKQVNSHIASTLSEYWTMAYYKAIA